MPYLVNEVITTFEFHSCLFLLRVETSDTFIDLTHALQVHNFSFWQRAELRRRATVKYRGGLIALIRTCVPLLPIWLRFAEKVN